MKENPFNVSTDLCRNQFRDVEGLALIPHRREAIEVTRRVDQRRVPVRVSNYLRAFTHSVVPLLSSIFGCQSLMWSVFVGGKKSDAGMAMRQKRGVKLEQSRGDACLSLHNFRSGASNPEVSHRRERTSVHYSRTRTITSRLR